ncbi:hypothetical protein EYF80_006884 [Liparis tanakae]|uniref:Uncharacterized protein n=1 Tax=Liparis tanakae TaxID=230148 RepID=A0A4Z2IYT9_9TELE|nr:hypothetical protein EYF80_006884 [Liparis tanakae]
MQRGVQSVMLRSARRQESVFTVSAERPGGAQEAPAVCKHHLHLCGQLTVLIIFSGVKGAKCFQKHEDSRRPARSHGGRALPATDCSFLMISAAADDTRQEPDLLEMRQSSAEDDVRAQGGELS